MGCSGWDSYVGHYGVVICVWDSYVGYWGVVVGVWDSYVGYCGVVFGVWDSYVDNCGVVAGFWDSCLTVGFWGVVGYVDLLIIPEGYPSNIFNEFGSSIIEKI